MHPVVRFADARDGSFAITGQEADLAQRRLSITGRPTSWLTQLHGTAVVAVDRPSQGQGEGADASVATTDDMALSVITADCAPVLLGSSKAVAAVHAGWRGLVGGVLQEAVAAMRARGAVDITAWLGPCLRTRCYEFGESDLATVAGALGPSVRGETAWGTPALDVTASVHAALAAAAVTDVIDTGICTACSPVHFSHRARGDTGRQAAFIWLEP